MGDLSVDELGNSVTKFLNIQDNQERVSGSILPSVKHGIENTDECEGPHQSEFTTVTSEKCLSKSATFPSSCNILSSGTAYVGEGSIGEAKDGANDTTTELTHSADATYVAPPCPRSISMPACRTLVSAMKGSREKQGAAAAMKLTVKWAPDVYDPTPTSVSHVVTNKPQRHSKKYAKNKQKGASKSSRGSKGKEKKQAKKHGGGSNRGFKLLDYEEKVVDFCEPQPSAVEFHVGNPDQFCGSSFFKKSVTSLHFSVAEAT